MNILVIHEIDWTNKVIFEPHHLSELFSKSGHNVFVIDCPDSKNKIFTSGFRSKIIQVGFVRLSIQDISQNSNKIFSVVQFIWFWL